MPRELKQAVGVKPAVQALTRAAQSIDRAILDPEAYSLLFGAMVPYIQGRADYGTCRQKAQRDVDFYLDVYKRQAWRSTPRPSASRPWPRPR